MQKEIRRNRKTIVLVALAVLSLIFIRFLESNLFYDPFAFYFKNDYLSLPFPKFEGLTLFLSMTMRYAVNSALSLLIIFWLFKDWELTKFVAILYTIFFLFLIIAFFGLILYTDQYNNFILFYVRRFLIQPILLLLFIPAIFYQRRMG